MSVSTLKAKGCSKCGSTTHTGMGCYIVAKRSLIAKTALKKVGKQGKRTAMAVTQWKRQQKPNHQGYFICYMCGKWVSYLQAEHVQSKARSPEKRTDLNNLKPTCSDCNAAKGSKSN